MVKHTTPENWASGKGMEVASPWITVTLLERILAARELASAESISNAVSPATREHRMSVVSPGPGPTSKTFDPRFTPSRAQGTTLAFNSFRQRSDRQSQR